MSSYQFASAGTGVQAAERLTVHLADGPARVAVYERAQLGAGDHVEGPAIITQLDATTLVRPGWTVAVHASGALLLTFAEEKA